MPNAPQPSPAAIRAQVDRLQRSNLFAGSDRLLVLLRFIVEETLGGTGAALKEAVIGNAVYGREPPYDPRIDSTVRVEARRLRRRLAEYYAGEGLADPVRISLPTGRYVPLFGLTEPGASTGPPQDGAIFIAGSGAAIAVMPFRALSRGPEDDNFADGLTDELIFALGGAQGLRVISRSIAFQYRDRAWSPAELARELGVDAVMQGTVRREASVIRVTVEVSDPGGFAVWSDRFDAPDQDHMRLQEQVAAMALSRIRFDTSRLRARQIGPGPAALAAQAKVIRARQQLDRQTPAGIREALALFTEIAESVPDYARGHSGIADCHCDMFRLGLIDRATAAAAALPAALRALAIDPRSVEAHCAKATIAAWLDWDRDAADAGFQQALALGENARAARLYAVFLTILQQHEEAERLFQDARMIEPFSVQQDIAEAVAHYQARRFHLLTDAALAPGGARLSAEAAFFTALAQVFGGAPARARALIAGLDHAARGLPELAFAEAEIEAWLGEPARGRRLLDRPDGEGSAFARAALAAALGEDERCLDALQTAVEQRALSAAWLPSDRRFDALRGSLRFQDLLSRLNPVAIRS